MSAFALMSGFGYRLRHWGFASCDRALLIESLRPINPRPNPQKPRPLKPGDTGWVSHKTPPKRPAQKVRRSSNSRWRHVAVFNMWSLEVRNPIPPSKALRARDVHTSFQPPESCPKPPAVIGARGRRTSQRHVDQQMSSILPPSSPMIRVGVARARTTHTHIRKEPNATTELLLCMPFVLTS